MYQVGSGANCNERQSRLARSCTDSRVVRPELAKIGKLLTRIALAPFGCEEVVIKHGEREDRSAGKLVVPKLPVETMSDEQGLSGSGKNERQLKEPMEQDHDPAGNDDDKASVGGASSLDFKFWDKDEKMDKLDDSKERMSELVIDSALDES